MKHIKISLLALMAAFSIVCSAPVLAQRFSGNGISLPTQRVPSGTPIQVKLLQPLSSRYANIGDSVRVAVVGGSSGLPAGTRLDGQITDVRPATPTRPGFINIVFGTGAYRSSTLRDIASVHLVGTVAKAQKPKDIGIGAGAGALLGLARKGKIGDALTGAGLGALGGYALEQSQKHSANDLSLKSGSMITLRLRRPLILQTIVTAG